MKKLVAAILLATAAPVWANCSYPLDGTQADLDATPITQGWTKATVYNGQSMEGTITPTAGFHIPYAALSHDGLVAMQQAAATNTPMGDLVLPSTGVVHVRMHIDEFPWGTFSGPLSGAGMFVTVLTGNQGPDNTLPKDALQLNVGLLNSNYTANRTSMLIVGQSIRGSYVGSVNRLDPVSLPLPGDVVGFWINVDTREIGLSFRITAVDPNLPPPGDYDLEPLKDSQGNAFLLPQGVTSVAIGLGALVNQVPVTDPLQGARFGATLLTDACGSSEPPPQTLPNGNPFMGKAAPKKFQGLPFPFVGQPPFAGTGNGNK